MEGSQATQGFSEAPRAEVERAPRALASGGGLSPSPTSQLSSAIERLNDISDSIRNTLHRTHQSYLGEYLPDPQPENPSTKAPPPNGRLDELTAEIWRAIASLESATLVADSLENKLS